MLPGGRLQTSTLYQLLHAQDATEDGAAKFVGNSAAPPRVRFFGWLLSRDRIQRKMNLLKKSVVTDATCELCDSDAETVQHIVFDGPFAHSFWAALGFHLPAGQAIVRRLSLLSTWRRSSSFAVGSCGSEVTALSSARRLLPCAIPSDYAERTRNFGAIG
jgi:hypothetical protein